ncbi:MAG: thioredoxin family protein [Myxococcota bacterium]|nr:thioredoxin family protein [Myxococcota bacterium]
MNEDERPPREAEDPSDETTSRDEARESAEPSETTSSDGAREEVVRDASPSDDESRAGDASSTGDASEEGASAKGGASDVAPAATSHADDPTPVAKDESRSEGEDPSGADVANDEEVKAASPPPREETEAALEAEAAAAREAVTEASKPEPPRYPPPDARTQKLAGWGCVFLLIALTFGFVVVFRVAFMRLTALDTNMNGYEITTAPGDATRREDREPDRTHGTAPVGGGVPWRTDLEAAFREARQTERPLLLHFEARWAMASRDMLDGTYANVTVREALGSFVPVRIDLTERDANEEELVRRYRVEGLPHVVYVAPDGDRLRPDSKTLVDASDMEVFLQEALGAWQDGRRYDEPAPADQANAPGVTGSNGSNDSTSPPSTNEP